MVKYTEKTVDAFVQYSKRKDILQAAGIGRTKYYTLRNDQDFMEKVQQRRTETVAATVHYMESNLIGNAEKLQAIINNPPERAQIIINALQLFFNTYHSIKTDAETQSRLDALEEAAKTYCDNFSTFKG